jgi:hypothetical protein
MHPDNGRGRNRTSMPRIVQLAHRCLPNFALVTLDDLDRLPEPDEKIAAQFTGEEQK